MPFTETSTTGLAMTGAVVSQTLDMTGNPNICYLSASFASTVVGSEQANSVYFRYGATPLPVDAMNASLIKPGLGQSVAIPISGGQPSTLSALGMNGAGLSIVMGIKS